jgi:hypothetical protein
VPFLALDAETHNVTLVEVELCVIVAPDVDLFVLFAVQESAEAGWNIGFAEMGSAGEDGCCRKAAERRRGETNKSVFGKSSCGGT